MPILNESVTNRKLNAEVCAYKWKRKPFQAHFNQQETTDIKRKLENLKEADPCTNKIESPHDNEKMHADKPQTVEIKEKTQRRM